MTGYSGGLTFNSAGNTITLTSTGTIFTGSTTATIFRSGASLTGDNIVTFGSTTATKTITTGAVSETNALNFNINTTSTGPYALGTSVFGNFVHTAAPITTSGITVYGDLYLNSVSSFTGSITMAPGLSVAATAMVAGTKYTITSAGTTNFTSYGATSNKPNTLFTATGPGTGTGTVTPTRFIYTYYTSVPLYIGNGSSQGSVALAASISSLTGVTIQSGFFNNNANRIDLQNTGQYFNYNNSNTKNIVINAVPSSLTYSLRLSADNNSFNGSSTNTTLDFSTAILSFSINSITYSTSQTFSSGIKIGTVILNFSGSVASTFAFLGNNITIYNFDISGYYNFSANNIVQFDAASNIYMGNLRRYSGSYYSITTRIIIKSSIAGNPFTLNKIGGGCGYFVGTALQDCTGSPSNAWVANTGVTNTYNNNYFGNNTNVSGNSGIVFNQYPALGGFNEFF